MAPTNQFRSARMLRPALSLFVLVSSFQFLRPEAACSQGETTSAIVGIVTDASGAGVPGAAVTVTNKETGLKRTAKTDESGRFNFPQLKPGNYSVKVEAQGFEPQENDSVASGLGQKQTVDFTMKVARAMESIEVNGEAAI